MPVERKMNDGKCKSELVVLTSVSSGKKGVVFDDEFEHKQFAVPVIGSSNNGIVCVRNESDDDVAKSRLCANDMLYDIVTHDMNQLILTHNSNSRYLDIVKQQIWATAGNYIVFGSTCEFQPSTMRFLETMGYNVLDVRFEAWDDMLKCDESDIDSFCLSEQNDSFMYEIAECLQPRMTSYNKFAIFVGYTNPDVMHSKRFDCLCSCFMEYIYSKFRDSKHDNRFVGFTNVFVTEPDIYIKDIDKYMRTAWADNARIVLTARSYPSIGEKYGADSMAYIMQNSSLHLHAGINADNTGFTITDANSYLEDIL